MTRPDLTPEEMEAEAGRLLVASDLARAARMGPSDAHEFPEVHIEANGRKVVEFGSWGFGDGRTDPRIDPFIGRSAPATLRIDLEKQGLTLDLSGPPWTIENVRRIIEQLEAVIAFKESFRLEAHVDR